MKKFFAILVTLLMLTSAAFAQAAEFASDFAASAYGDTGAMIRYWLPGAPVDLDEMKNEIAAMAAAGITAIEVALVDDSGNSIAPENRWDTENWYNCLVVLLETAKEVGIRVDLTVSAHWPLMIPGVGVDSVAAQQVLKTGFATVEPGTVYSGSAPACDTALGNGASADTLMGVTVGKVIGTKIVQSGGGWQGPVVETTVYILDPGTLQSVAVVDGGTIDWTAPTADANYDANNEQSAGKWGIVSFWMRGSAQQPAGANGAVYTNADAYVVDHFSMAGTQAFIDYWNENLLTDEVKGLLAEVGGSFFEDSLEVSGTLTWTPEFQAYFQANMGYDITPYLPALYGMVNDDELAARVKQDYEQTLNDMYIANHVLPIQEFVNSLGMTFRTQSYGGTVDSSQTAQIVDIIEGELLTFSGGGIALIGDNTVPEWTVDNKFRVERGGANMAGKTIISDEIGSLINGDWVLPQDRLLEFLNSDFSAGVNNAVFHGYPYQYFSGSSWPTGMTFSPVFGPVGFGSVFSNDIPNWMTVDEFLAYVNRTQYILKAGQSDIDVAIYRDETSMADKLIADGTLVDAGFSYDYISPANLTDDNGNAIVANGVLAENTASYKALVLYDAESITIEGANKILELAKAGLPVVISTTVPTVTRGYSEANRDSEVVSLMDELLLMPNVRYVVAEADVSKALLSMGVKPDTSFSVAEPYLTTVHRKLDNADYYYLFNRGYDHMVDVDVTFAGTGTAYALDSYSGVVEVIADAMQNGDGTVTLPVKLEQGDTTIIVISADAYYADGAAAAVRAGTTEESLELSSWILSLESWWPANEDVSRDEVVSNMDDLSRYETKKETSEIALDGVQAWSTIPGYENACGIGTYTTNITLTQEQADAMAILDLGKVDNAFEVYINGVQVRGNLITGEIDLTGYLAAGDNQLVIVVPSEMINALTVVRSNIYGPRDHTVNGLQENPVLIIK